MGRPSGTKNVIRSPKEKEQIILEYLNGKVGYRVVARSHNISGSTIKKWIKEELFLDFNLKQSDNVEQTIKDYVYYFNNDRPAYSLEYKTPTQFKTKLGLSSTFL